MNKRTIFLVICIVLPALPLLTGLFFSVREWQHHRKMKHALERSLLQKITVKTDQVVWIKKGKEILYNDQYFDIKSSERNGDYTIFTGLYDKAEKLLKKKAGLLNKHGLPVNKLNACKILLIGLYHEPNIYFKSFIKLKDNSVLFATNTSQTLEGYVLLPTQPPNMS